MSEPVLYIKDAVEKPHTVWSANVDFWNFLMQSYEGGIRYTNSLITGNNKSKGGFLNSLMTFFVNGVDQSKQITEISGNLFQHPKEKTEDYNRRLNMSYYYNFCAPVIDIYKNHLFKDAVIEDWGSIEAEVAEREENIDNSGSSIQEFRKYIAEMTQLYGHIFIIVDAPRIVPENEPVTLRDQMDEELYPYFTTHQPQNVLNWSLDKNGQPYWVLLREYADQNVDVTAYDKTKISETFTYLLWTRTDWSRYDKDYCLIEGQAHNLGIVPIVCIFDKKSKYAKNFLGVSSIADIAFISRDIYNSCSELKQILRDQTFSFLAIQGTADEYNELSTGTGKGLLYPEGRNVPQYVSPPADNANIYFSHIDRQVSKIYQLAKLESGGLSGSVKIGQTVNTANQSGVAKAWDFNETNSALNEKAMNLEDGEMKLWMIFALWLGKEFDGSIKYPDEFSVSSLMDDITEAEEASKLQLGKTFDIEVKKTIQKKKFPNANQEELNTMASELEGISQVDIRTNDIVKRFQFLNQTKNAVPGGE